MKQQYSFFLCFLLVLALGSGIFFLARQQEAKQQVTTPTAKNTAQKSPLQFVFSDKTVEQVPDTRSGAYSFTYQGVSIGLLELASQQASSTSFSSWAHGLKGTLKVGDVPTSTTLKEFGSRTALSFETIEGAAHATNMMTQYGDITVWLQTRASSTVLEAFSQTIQSIHR